MRKIIPKQGFKDSPFPDCKNDEYIYKGGFPHFRLVTFGEMKALEETFKISPLFTRNQFDKIMLHIFIRKLVIKCEFSS